jgi:dihydroorotase
VLALLRPGDVLTHCFRPFPNTPVSSDGTIKPTVITARERGVKFDIGHGMGSFAFATARPMLAGGFLPDVISSDLHQLCLHGPAIDQAVTLSKFVCLGVPLTDVIRMTTDNPAKIMRREDLGTLRPGARGDATIFTVEEGSYDYVDVVGEVLTGDKKIVASGIVLDGRWWHPN